MSITHYYYLHTNGSLICKPASTVENDPQYFDSNFVVKYWPCDLSNRETAWNIIIESLALGADIARVKDLCEKWACDINDAHNYLARTTVTDLKRKGFGIFLTKIANIDPKKYWNWLGATPTGTTPNVALLHNQQ